MILPPSVFPADTASKKLSVFVVFARRPEPTHRVESALTYDKPEKHPRFCAIVSDEENIFKH